MPSFSGKYDPEGAPRRDSIWKANQLSENEMMELFPDSASREIAMTSQVKILSDSVMTIEEATEYFSQITPFKRWSQSQSDDVYYGLNADSTQLRKLINAGLFQELFTFKKQK